MKTVTIAAKLDKLSKQINSANPYHESNPKYFDWVAPKEIADLSDQYTHLLDLYGKARERESIK